MQNKGQSIFTMEAVNVVVTMPFAEAKAYALNIVNANSTAREVSIQKAKKMISKAKDSSDLAFGMSNFILSHSDLKVIK